MANENADKDHGIGPANKLRQNFRLGDITWVKYNGSSWWPAQVIDESCVSSKPKKKDKYDCLVRLYGTCQYLYIDPWKSNSEFEMMLKQENKSAMEAFREVLEKELSCNSYSGNEEGYEEEAANSKGSASKGTSKKSSSRKVRKQEGLKQQYNEEEDQDFGSNATTGSAQKRKGGRARQSSSTHNASDKNSSENSADGLRNKRLKHVGKSASVGRREGLKRAAHSGAKQYRDAAEGSAEPPTDLIACEGATEDSMLYGTSAPHTEIKAMVRDILFKDIIDKEHDAEMAYVNEVINGICNATEDSAIGGLGVKHSGSGVEGESSNATKRQRDEATEDAFEVTTPKTTRGDTGGPPSRGTAVKTPGQLSARQTRQIRIMQTLALIAPSGSPFGRNGAVAAK